jgi:formylglycine-generating enzyme required for sulfatase activity
MWYVGPRIRDYLILRGVQAKINQKDELKYVLIPQGIFEMGCSSLDVPSYDCPPSMTVEITEDYWMGQTEVTNQAYRRFLQNRREEKESIPGEPNVPVRDITWLDAMEYCSWVGGSLPSNAEWEYAARAGLRGKRFITGDKLDERVISIGSSPSTSLVTLPTIMGCLT